MSQRNAASQVAIVAEITAALNAAAQKISEVVNAGPFLVPSNRTSIVEDREQFAVALTQMMLAFWIRDLGAARAIFAAMPLEHRVEVVDQCPTLEQFVNKF